MPQTLIVIPCYNEARRLDVRKFEEFSRENPCVRFLFVDDGSTDATGAMLDDLHRGDPGRFDVCNLPANVGKAEAVRGGLLRAFEEGVDYVGYWDADLATPLDAIRAFVSVLDARPEIGMVVGARVKLLGRVVERRPLRHYLGRVFATGASLVLGMHFYDTQCGAKLFRASPEMRGLFQSPFHNRWIFDVEIIARLIAARRDTDRPPVVDSLYEYPLEVWRDVDGSKVRARDFVAAFFGLAAIYRKYGRLGILPRKRPSPVHD